MVVMIVAGLYISIMYFVVHAFTISAPPLLILIKSNPLFKYLFFFCTILIIAWSFFWKSSFSQVFTPIQETILCTPFFWVINILVLLCAKTLSTHGKAHLFPITFLFGIAFSTLIYYVFHYLTKS